MNGIGIVVALAIINASASFYMVGRPGGIFRLRNDMVGSNLITQFNFYSVKLNDNNNSI